MECGTWSVECKVRSVERESLEYKAWSVERGERRMESKVWNADSGVESVQCGV